MLGIRDSERATNKAMVRKMVMLYDKAVCLSNTQAMLDMICGTILLGAPNTEKEYLCIQ